VAEAAKGSIIFLYLHATMAPNTSNG